MTITLSFSIPDDIAEELDRLAEKWRGSRSAAITRIYLEWKEANRPQLPALTETVEAPAEVVTQ